MAMRAFTCLMMTTSSVASRFRIKQHTSSAAAVTLGDLEDTWLSIWNSRSGSYFAEGEAVFVVEKESVKLADNDKDIFGNLSMKQDSIILKTDANDVWALTGAETNVSKCSAWSEFFKLVQKMKEARKNPPPGMYSLAQVTEAEEIMCVDWKHTGEITSPPHGMYSLAEVSGVGERSMHWLKKPPPSEDEVVAEIEEAVFALTKELLRLSPPASSIKQKVAWASKAAHRLLRLQDEENLKATQALLWKWVNTSEFDLGMTEKLKSAIVRDILDALAVLKKVVSVKPSMEDV